MLEIIMNSFGLKGSFDCFFAVIWVGSIKLISVTCSLFMMEWFNLLCSAVRK